MLNWTLLDRSYRSPTTIEIPCHLYEKPSQFCLSLFKDELLQLYGVAAEDSDIMFWIVGGIPFSQCADFEPL